MKDEGVIKFTAHWIKEAPADSGPIEQLNAWRQRLHALGLIGVTEEGIGYGNASIRSGADGFLITGSGTGRLEVLSPAHYTRVTAFDLAKNTLTCAGPVMASSESLTHAAIYQAEKTTGAVFHVHHRALWKKLLQALPSTGGTIPYGTPEMALEVIRLLQENRRAGIRIFAMGGHEDGIIAFGKDAGEAGQVLLEQLGIEAYY